MSTRVNAPPRRDSETLRAYARRTSGGYFTTRSRLQEARHPTPPRWAQPILMGFGMLVLMPIYALGALWRRFADWVLR